MTLPPPRGLVAVALACAALACGCAVELELDEQAAALSSLDTVVLADQPHGAMSLAAAKHTWAVAWPAQLSPSDRSLRVTVADDAGPIVEGAIVVDDRRLGSSSIATVDGETFLVGWTTATGSWPYPHLELRSIDRSGAVIGAPLSYDAPAPAWVGAVRLVPADHQYAIVFVEDHAAMLRWTDGKSLGAPVHVSSAAGGVGYIDAAPSGTSVVVAYVVWPRRWLVLAMVDELGRVVHRRIRTLDDVSAAPQVVAGPDSVAVVWEQRAGGHCDVYGYAATNDLRAVSERRHLASAPLPCALYPQVVVADGGFDVLWTSPSGSLEVQRTNAGMRPLGVRSPPLLRGIGLLTRALRYGPSLYLGWTKPSGLSLASRVPAP